MGRHGIKIFFFLAIFFLTGFSLGAQERYVSLNPVGIAAGYISAEYEQRIDFMQLFWTVSPVYYNASLTNFVRDTPVGGNQEETDSTWGVGVNAGVSYYLMNNNPSGFFFGGRLDLALLKGWVETSYDTSVQPPTSAGEIQQSFRVGMDFKAGYRWIWDSFSFAPFAGVAYGLIVGGDYSSPYAKDQSLYRINMNPDTVLEKMVVFKFGDSVLFSSYACLGFLISFSF